MNKLFAKYFLYYPITFLKNEPVARYLRTYERFQWSDINHIQEFQLNSLKKLMIEAQHFPYYKNLFNKAQIAPEAISSLDELQNIPFIEKHDIIHISRPENDNLKPWQVTRKTTGGSTGQAVTILKSTDALARERAATWRAYRWAGVDIGDPQARFWGVPLDTSNRLKYMLVDFITNRRRLSAFEISDDSLETYYRSICLFKPSYFYGYVSMLLEFADFVDKRKYKIPDSLKSIITTSEVLEDNSRYRLESIFKCKVYNEYGCGEVGSIAHECEYGSMHIMSDNMICEIVDENGASAETGEIVITDLFNFAMPLIRYKLKDYATFSVTPCECGRGLPVISKIHGRAYDLIVDSAGVKYHPELIMYIFEDLKKQNSNIEQFQVIQTEQDLLDVILVTSSVNYAQIEEYISREIRKRISPSFKINFIYRDSIERERSGKIRLIKNELS
jgi:phenylacetate-CoA ligase